MGLSVFLAQRLYIAQSGGLGGMDAHIYPLQSHASNWLSYSILYESHHLLSLNLPPLISPS